ncbi:MAG: hypothetical protein ACK4F4_07310 [Hylemonella sp.]|uniref:hypothetical protein n=1 Tax=Hylemonella sp. TaxID=2066020 RepID=UPI00391AC4E4
MTPFVQAQSYVGMPYRTGEFDCGDLARLVMQQVFGRQIALPAQRTRPGGARGQAREILRLRDSVAKQVDLAFDGCAVLLWEPDEDADGHQVWHLGTAFVHAGEVWVLHNSARLQGAALHRLADLRRWGMRLDGFYAWKDAA